jgi:hypothetical protein
MTSARDHSPRRYFVDGNGNRVLIGLTVEETLEFETLDSQPNVDVRGGLAAAQEQRWLELYNKHDGAWMDWKTKIQDNRRENSGFVNYH